VIFRWHIPSAFWYSGGVLKQAEPYTFPVYWWTPPVDPEPKPA
jgi:hypothetical protein